MKAPLTIQLSDRPRVRRGSSSGVRAIAPGLIAAVMLAGCLALAGCGGQKEKEPVAVTSPYPEPITFAVAPVLNFSGDSTLDPLKAADLLASELTGIDGVAVMPVSRVAAYLATQNKTQIESPAHAVAVAQAVGADAILVAGITEYDPYTPIVGVILQVYRARPAASRSLDPVAASRDAQPLAMSETADPFAPTSQVQEVYNGSHEWVVKAVKKYADHRNEDPNPLGWRQYLKVQTLYLRFCWRDGVERLLRQEGEHVSLMAAGQASEPR
jgi:hypothetical protein